MKKIFCAIIILFLIFGFTNSKTKETIPSVIKKMNSFYFNKAVKMSIKTTFYKNNREQENEQKYIVTKYKDNFLSISSEQVILSNSEYYLEVDKVSKVIYVSKLSSGTKGNNAKRKSILDVEELLQYYTGKSIRETKSNYVIKLSDKERVIEVFISKKDFHLVKYHTSNNYKSYYRKVEVDYDLEYVKKKISNSIFSENKYIKSTAKGYKGIGKYKKYTISTQ